MNREFYTRYFDAWNRHAADEIVGFLTHDCTYIDVALGESHTGPSEIRDFVAHVEQAFSSDYQFDSGFGVLSETGYALEWVLRGTHDRSSDQLAATGKPFAIRGVSVGEIRDDKIARNTDYWSLAELLMQVGLMPPLGATTTT